MSPDNLSAVMHGVNDLRLEQRKIPVPAGNQLLISGDQSSFSIVWLTHNINLHRIHTVGICGSDVHFLTRGAIGKYVVEKPMVLGHETSGTVAGMGNLVKGFQVGDRVAIEPGVGCRFCMHCKSGRYNLCPDTKFFATPPTDGSLTRYVAYDADFCFK
uniref:Sorbitol dehydrogenase n=1 Tax=Haemonchus contortus TaxID=6289 RepID=W6NC82_HAECO